MGQTVEEPDTLVALDKFKNSNPNGYEIISEYQSYFFDSSMDTLGYYLEWRPKTKNPRGFLDRLLKKWGVKQWIPEYPILTLKKIIQNSATSLLINDDATIGIAIAALVVDKKIGKQLKHRAIVCINRQMQDMLINEAGYSDKEAAKKMLRDLKILVEQS